MCKNVKTIHRISLASLTVFLLMLTVSNAFGQVSTATISGTVRDSTNAVIPGATITVTNVDTGIMRNVTTDQVGRYVAPSLPVGNYEVKVEMQGFQSEVRKGITLTVGRESVVDFTLSLGQVAEAVTVTGEAPLVETTNAQMAALVDRKQMSDLPLNGRNYDQLALLAPGVQQITTAISDSFMGRGTRISVAGARPEGQAILLDGANIQGFWNSGAGSSITGTTLGVESIREYSTLTNTYSAEFAGAGAVINAVTKSGTNQLHGTVFEFLRNDNLDARRFFDRGKPEFRRNQFGFSLGGPIQQNKTFFFANFEGLRQEQFATAIGTVPDENAHRGFLPDPLNPGSLINVGVNLNVAPALAVYPLPTPGARNFGNGTAQLFSVQPRPLNESFVVGRIDHNISDSDSFFVRYNFDDSELIEPYSRTAIPGFPETSQGRNQYVTLEEKKIVTSSLLNVARFSFVRTQQTVFNPAQEPALQFFKIPGRQIGNLNAGSGVSTIGSSILSPLRFVVNTFSLADDMNYIKGSHSMRFGLEVNRLQNNYWFDFNGGGTYSFGNLTDFLRNRPNSFRGPLPGADSNRGFRQILFGFYFQDNYKVNQRLTLNLGLRYDFTTNPVEVNGKMANLIDPAKDTAFTVTEHYIKDNPTLKNFEPRFGFAWDPFGNQKFSVRGGFGIFYEAYLPRFYSHSNANPPFFPQGFSTAPTFPDPLVGLGAVPHPSVTNTMTYAGMIGTPHMLQYNLNIEREVLPNTVLTVGYIGSRGINLFSQREVNAVVGQIINGVVVRPTPAGNDSNRINPNFSRVSFLFPVSNSHYHSMQLSLNKRFSHGLQFTVAYTFSKSIDDSSQAFGSEQANAGSQLLDPDGDRSRDRGLSSFDVRHNMTTNFLYSLPSGPRKYFLDGWQVSGILTLRSATPFSVQNGFDRANNGNTTHDRPNLRPGASNNPFLGRPEKWFSTDSFVLQPAGTLGNVGRTTLQGPSLANLDISLLKNTPIRRISEEFIIQFRAEIFNIPNHPNFQQPSQRNVFTSANGIPNPNAGVVTDVVTSARQVQFGLKFIF